MSAPEKSICFTSCTRRIWTAANLSKTARGLQSRQHLSQSCRRKLEEEFLQRVVLLVICVSDLYKEWLFMNRREALMAAAGSIAAVVAIPSVASAETAETEDDNPELAPIRALLDAYDSGVLVVLGSPPCRRPKLGFGSIGGPSPRRMDQPMGWWSRQVDQPMGWSASRSMDQSVVMGTPNLSVSEENSISLKFLPQLW
jgi:hypothetical protein